MNKKTYLTTTIPYVNARPHVGFALELVQADALARYRRLVGERVEFQTGTDDNAFSNVLSARDADVPVEEFVRENSDHFRDLRTALAVSADRFIRTSESCHHKAVQAFISGLDPDDIYPAVYRGFYCVRCEDFYLERDLDNRRCPEHRIEADEVAESNFFFRLSRYEDDLHDLITSRRLKILPGTRETEVLSFIEQGLRDFSISRNAARSGGWGVPFPEHPEQVVYVWIDALINYISGLGYPSSEAASKTWNPEVEKIHVIGKNVWKFHAVYWPALLLSAGLDLPDTVLVHGFLTNDGRKISKSDRTATDPTEYIRRFGADAVRYYLLGHVRPFEDTDFSTSHLERVYSADLANTLGNLLTRLTALCEKAGVRGIEGYTSPPAPEGFHQAFTQFRPDLALSALFAEVALINCDLANHRPWDGLKAGQATKTREQLEEWASRLDAVAYWLSPFLPQTSQAIQQALRASEIAKANSLFPRLEE